MANPNASVSLLALRHGGTHLIQPIMQALTGAPCKAPKGDKSLTLEPAAKVVLFLRDPRNRMISNWRYKAGHHHVADMGAEEIDERLAKFLVRPKHGVEPIHHMNQWARRWLAWPGVHLVRFEAMADRDAGIAEVERLAAYLDAPGEPAAAYDATFGKSVTWTGRHSAWPDWFGPLSTTAWREGGGAPLVDLMGYQQ